VVEHEEANGGRQIAVLPLPIDRCHQFGQSQVPLPGNGLQTTPKFVFKADARLVAANNDRTLDNRRLHSPPLIFIHRLIRTLLQHFGPLFVRTWPQNGAGLIALYSHPSRSHSHMCVHQGDGWPFRKLPLKQPAISFSPVFGAGENSSKKRRVD
jgi:hypothetical protein